MLLSTLLTLVLPFLSSTTPALAATTCNGYPELCTKLYSGVTFIGTHNSYAIGETLADNQLQDVTTQLKDGVRTLQLQAHNSNGTIHVCHQSCNLRDGGTLQSYLTTVAQWVSANPNEVLTIVMVNFDNLPASSFASAYTAAGLSQYVYSPPSAQLALSAWPTLGNMIDTGKRVVVFMDNTADYASVPWIIDEFSNMFEDAYNVVDQTFGCAANRTSGSPGAQLMMVNHFLDTAYSLAGSTFWVPNTSKLNETNAQSGYGSIGAHVDNCRSIWGRVPNHILLDFYNSNGLAPFSVAASLNGVSAPTNVVQTAKPTITASASSGSGSGRTGSTGVTTSRLDSGSSRVKEVSFAGAVGLGFGFLGLICGAGLVF